MVQQQASYLGHQWRRQHQLAEEVLLADDLPKVRLWVGNALRGLIPAVWAG